MPGTTIKLSQQESDQLILSTKRVIIVANTNVFKTTITIITKQQQKSRVWLDWKNNQFALGTCIRLFCTFLSHKLGTTIFLEYCPHRSSSLISFLLLLCQMLVVLPLEEVHSSSATFGALLHRPKQVPRH